MRAWARGRSWWMWLPLSVVCIGGVAWTGSLGASELTLWDQWTKKLDLIDHELRAADWSAASTLARGLAEEMVHQSGGTLGYMRAYADQLDGARIGQGYLAEAIALGRVAAYLALANAGQGKEQEARWYWYAAQNLDHKWVAADLSAYRGAGVVLAKHRILPEHQQVAELDVIDPIVPEGAKKARFKEPERVRVVYPERPRDLAGFDRFSEALFVQVTIEADGSMTQAVLVDGLEYPSLMFKVFEAMSGWRYRPATFDGRVIPFRYVVPVVFKDDRPRQSAVFF